MKLYVLLNDGSTFTNIEGCEVLALTEQQAKLLDKTGELSSLGSVKAFSLDSPADLAHIQKLVYRHAGS